MSRRTSIKPTFDGPKPAGPFRLEAKLQFVTPLFGGGVELEPSPKEHKKGRDPITPVRGSALGGALREWWRRIHGRGLVLAELKEREGRLWGWSSQKGLVRIAVDGRKLGEGRETFNTVGVEKAGKARPRAEGQALAYAAFPIQGSDRATDTSERTLPMMRGTFIVRLELDEARVGEPEAARLWEEVQDAWRAFVAFGGLGGRTRRGFGAVEVVEGPGHDLDPTALARMNGWTLATRGPVGDACAAWTDAIRCLQSFRQGVGLGRNRGTEPNRPGRSNWPEPDEIRRLTGQANSRHREPRLQIPAFPRAAFGMPIIFHFKDGSDPADTQLLPRGRDRMASPLILRPMKTPQGWVAGALLVHEYAALDRILGDLELKGRPGSFPATGRIGQGDQAKIHPLSKYRTRPSAGAEAVLEPFLDYFTKH